MALKSLRNSLLEYAVLNADKYFPCNKLEQWNPEDTRDDIKNLPPGLFDQILEKSLDMFWKIPDRCLIPCLINRDKVKWRDVNYVTKKMVLTPRKLELIIQRGPPIVKFCFAIWIRSSEDLEVFKVLDKLADSLESLTLDVKWLDSIPRDEISRVFVGRPVLRLKQLTVNTDLDLICLNLDPLAMRVLDIRMTQSGPGFLNRLGEFQNLRHLSLYAVTLKDVPFSDLLKTLSKLKNLRLLNLQARNSDGSPCILTGEDLNRLLSSLTFLEELEIWDVSTTSSAIDQPVKKLRLLSISSRIFESVTRDQLDLVADKILELESFVDLFDYSEMTRSTCRIHRILAHLPNIFKNLSLERENTVVAQRLESLTLKLLKEEYFVIKALILEILELIKTSDCLSCDFLTKIAHVWLGCTQEFNLRMFYQKVEKNFLKLLEGDFLTSYRRRDKMNPSARWNNGR